MIDVFSRRDFLKTATLAGAAVSMGGGGSMGILGEETPAAKSYKTGIFKAFIAGDPTPEVCRSHADAGFQGLEVTRWDVDADQAREGRKIAEDHGLRVHSIMRGWAALNSDDEGTRADSVESIKKAIRTAAVYGADAILLVPCRIDNAGCAPWEFDIEFDPTTCRVKKITNGDNSAYAEYISLQNIATERTFAALQEVIPTAAYEGVTLCLENVWNNLWVTPKFAAAFVRMFDSRWVRAYFDMGNHVKYAPTVEWLRAFGSELLTKLHIKDYRFDDTTKADPWKGFCGLGNGTVDWVEVRNCLEELHVSSWVSYEEGNYSPAEYGVILDHFVNGRPVVAPVR